MGDIKLVYFNVRARAEPMRLAMVAAGKKFEDVQLGFEQWPAEKPKSPYGSLPYVEYKGKIYGESKAVASFIAREAGMAGKTSEEQMRVDEIHCLSASLLEDLAKNQFEQDADKKMEGEKKLKSETIPKFLGFFEKLIKESGKGFCVGTGLTLADMAVYNITETVLKVNPSALDSYPEIQKVRKNVEANANVKAYLAKRPKTDM